MQLEAGWLTLISVMLIVANAFLVAAEYAIVSARRGRIEGLARRGNRTAKKVLITMNEPASFIAVCQVGISMVAIGLGSVSEPYITTQLQSLFGEGVPRGISYVISLVLVTYVLVVAGELAPKYISLKASEKVLLATYQPMNFIAAILRPLTWLTHATTSLIVRPFGIDLDKRASDAIPRDELLMLIQAGGAEGVLEKSHAEMVTRALRIDALTARDIMIHRLDIKWLDLSLTKEQLLARLRQIPFTRLPVCRGDIDEMAGVVYLHDIVKNLHDPDFNLEKILRPTVAIPENLNIAKIVAQMRDSKTQILIVMDEYGGTSGLITLEDVVEEIFGELEDRLESERPPIETYPTGRISARADIRYDELLDKLGLRMPDITPTETLATILVNALGRVPRPGDSAETELGLMRVENMARRRITRVSIQLKPELLAPSEEDEG